MTTDLSPVLINTFTQSSVNPDQMILAAYNYSVNNPIISVKISVDGGYNWTDVTANIPGESRWVSRVKTHPWDANTMFIVRCGYSDSNKIYRTTNLGQTWTNVSGNLPDIPCNDLFIDPGYPGHYYVGTDLGVYLTEDGGTTYQYIGEGMPLVPIMEFDYSDYEGMPYLRVATHGRGIFETQLAVGENEYNISPNLLLNISPNPCINKAIFTYELQEAGAVTIAIYSQFGQLIEYEKILQTRGVQRFEWKNEGLPGGIYFVNLRSNGNIASKKIILMK